MKAMSRGARGKAISKATGYKQDTKGWYGLKNPLKGDPNQVATAKITIRGAGVFVGFKVKF